MNEERTWTGNSEVDAAIVMLDRIDCSPKNDSRIDAVETTLRRLYARNQELEARLQKLQSYYDAVGAGGVSAQRITQVAPQPQAVDQAPVAWRYQTPTGWHATTDAAAANRVSAHHPVEPLYASPQPQEDARDAELVAAVVYASAEAMASSMESPSFDGTIILESHHAASLSLALDELEQHRDAIAAAQKGKA